MPREGNLKSDISRGTCQEGHFKRGIPRDMDMSRVIFLIDFSRGHFNRDSSKSNDSYIKTNVTISYDKVRPVLTRYYPCLSVRTIDEYFLQVMIS